MHFKIWTIEKLYQRKPLHSKEPDDSKLQFEEFIDNVVKCKSDKFLSFNICSSTSLHFFMVQIKLNVVLASMRVS